MPFTNTEKALMDRSARNLIDQAQQIYNAQAVPMGWGATKDSKKAKLEYDRLQRDARDLRALAKRMMPAPLPPITE